MFRLPYEGKQEEHLLDGQFEFSQAFLTRTSRMLFLRGPIFSANPGHPMSRLDSFGPTSICDDIVAMNKVDNSAPICLWIDSPGGDVGAGMVLYDIIRMSKAPVVTVAQNCASMATVLMAAGSTRLMLPHSRAMLHLPRGSFDGDPEDVAVRSKELMLVKDILVDCYVECGVTAGLKPTKTGRQPTKLRVGKQIIKDINRSEFWMSAKECAEYGLIDRVATASDIFKEVAQ